MKRLFVVCALLGLLFLSADSAEAQGFGLKGGLTWASLRGDSGDADVAYDRGSGWAAGLFFSLNAGPTSLQPEVMYTRRTIDIQVAGAEAGSFELDYVEVPVLLRTGGGSSAFYLGGYGALRINAKTVSGSGEEQVALDIASSVEQFDYGWLVGAEIAFGAFGIDARLSRGLKKIFKDQPGSPAPDLKHGALSVLAYYRF